MPFLAVLSMLVACGPVDSTDAGAAPDAGVDAAIAIAPPDIAWLEDGVPPLALTPCRTGYREVALAGIMTCRPYGEAGQAVCAAGEAHFPGEAGCRPLGEACPAGEFAEALDGRTVYVSAGAASGGDGSRGAPFARLADVQWLSAGAGTTIALGTGSYAGTLPLKAGVRVIGACAARTILTGTAGPITAVVSVTTGGDPAELRDVSIIDPPQRAVNVVSGRALNLSSVFIHGATERGVNVAGAGSVITARDVVIHGTTLTGGRGGYAVVTSGGARFEATRFIAAGNQDVSVFSEGDGTRVVLADAVVRDTLPNEANGLFGVGIAALEGGHVQANGLLLAHNHLAGMTIDLGGSAAVVEDTIVRESYGELDESYGHGIDVTRGGSLEARRMVFLRNRVLALGTFGEDTTTRIEDAVFADTQPGAGGRGGRGIAVTGGAAFVGARVLVTGSHYGGVFAEGEGTVLSLEDAAIDDTVALARGDGGTGVMVQLGARIEARRVAVRHNEAAGVVVLGNAEGDFVDLLIEDTRPVETGFGYGLVAERGSHVTASRLAIRDVYELGLATLGASFSGSDVSIHNVRASQCDCPGRGFGYAIESLSGEMTLSHFEAVGGEICGLLVGALEGEGAAAGMLDLRAGLVANSEIGACVQVDDYDLFRLTDEVDYWGNEVNLDATSLPVPEFTDVARAL